MIIAVHQPNFLPWLGYFHKISRSDRFVLIDDVQYVKGSVANRAFILRKDGKAVYITVPVKLSKGSYQNYNEIEIDYTARWPGRALNLIKDSYIKSPHFQAIFPSIEDIFKKRLPVLSDLNTELIRFALDYLEIKTPLTISSSIKIPLGSKSDRNLNLCLYYKADKYISGTGAKKYNDEDSFREKKVELIYTRFNLDDEYTAPDEQGKMVNLGILHFLFEFPKEKINELIYCPSIESY